MFYDFNLCTPTNVVFGKNSTDKCGALLKEAGAKKVLIHYGSHHAEKTGLIDRIKAQLEKEGIEYVTLPGVVPNPRISLAREGIKLGEKENVDFILAVGGGSVIDSSKAIGYGLFDHKDPWDLYSGKRVATGCLPIGAVLTIAAAGSEMSDSSVLTNCEEGLKKGYNSQYCRCTFAIEDPLLTLTLPEYQTASGSTDIIMHTLERYFASGDHNKLIDGMSEALIKAVMTDAKTLLREPDNYDARAEVMFASSVSHNDLLQAGLTGRGDWASHRLEHELGAMFDCAHGAGLAAVWSSWARYVAKNNPSRFARLGEGVFGLEKGDDAKTAETTIGLMEEFFHSIKMPANLNELGHVPTDEEIEIMATKCTADDTKTIGSYQKLKKADLIAIYKAARK